MRKGGAGLGLLLLLPLLLLASALHERIITIQRSGGRAADPFITLPKGEYLKVAVLGYDHIVADLYWLRAVQHIGDEAWAEQHYPHLFSLANLITDLDPAYDYVYQTAGIVLAVHANRIEESNAILEKGMRANPEIWQLPFYLGFNHFFYLQDYRAAARYIRVAAELPGRPAYLPLLASRLLAQAGDPETALEFLARVYDETEDEQVRATLKRRIQEVLIERDLQHLERAVSRYHEQIGLPPHALGDLVTAGVIRSVPREPLGGQYLLDPETLEVRSTSLDERLRVHLPPPRP